MAGTFSQSVPTIDPPGDVNLCTYLGARVNLRSNPRVEVKLCTNLGAGVNLHTNLGTQTPNFNKTENGISGVSVMREKSKAMKTHLS